MLTRHPNIVISLPKRTARKKAAAALRIKAPTIVEARSRPHPEVRAALASASAIVSPQPVPADPDAVR